jgi:hypothetical protein
MHVEQGHERYFTKRLELNVIAKPNHHKNAASSYEWCAGADEMQKLSLGYRDLAHFFLAALDHEFGLSNQCMMR